MNKNPNTKFRIIFLLSILCIGVVSIHALEPESPTVILGPPDIYRVAHRINFVGSPYKWTPQYALKDKITADGQAYLNPMIGPKGFVVEKTARNEFLLYSPYDMAIAQGWYQPPSGRFTVTNNLRGFFRSRNSIWMGTGGLGVLEYHIADAKWSRYDIKKDATPGHAMTILYADDDYVFAGYSKLYVYSVQKDQWFEIAQVSTKGASLGRSGMGTQMVYDLSHYATEKYIPTNQPVGSLNLFGMPSFLRYDAETGEYVLSYGGQALVNMDEQHGPKPTILHIKKSDLAR